MPFLDPTPTKPKAVVTYDGTVTFEGEGDGLGNISKRAIIEARQRELTSEIRKLQKKRQIETGRARSQARLNLLKHPGTCCTGKWWLSGVEWWKNLFTDKYAWMKLRTNLHDMVHNPGRSWKGYFWNMFVCFFVVLSATLLIVETTPDLHRRYQDEFMVVFLVCQTVFSIELFIRLITITKFMALFQSYMLVDFFAVMLYWIWLAAGQDWLDWINMMSFVRLYRIMWFVRFGFGGNLTFWRLLYQRTAAAAAAPLGIMVCVYCATILIFGCFIYYVERGDWDSDLQKYYINGERSLYDSIPASCWWAVVTLGQLGYGDLTPVTTWGKLIACVASFSGVLVFTIPVTIISSTFRREHTSVVITVEKVQALFRGFNHRVKNMRYKSSLSFIVRTCLYFMGKSNNKLRLRCYSHGLDEKTYAEYKEYSATVARSGRAPVTMHDWCRACEALDESPAPAVERVDPTTFFNIVADDGEVKHGVTTYRQVNEVLDEYWEDLESLPDIMCETADKQFDIMAQKMIKMHMINLDTIARVQQMVFMLEVTEKLEKERESEGVAVEDDTGDDAQSDAVSLKPRKVSQGSYHEGPCDYQEVGHYRRKSVELGPQDYPWGVPSERTHSSAKYVVGSDNLQRELERLDEFGEEKVDREQPQDTIIETRTSQET